ncbi:MFS transporter [Capnocytophaga canimorsus]|nr:MFS transporter [Capnocytophaga canimorsus]WGU70295.1 MFS transporter [Capnocytophaga canimorsus]
MILKEEASVSKETLTAAGATLIAVSAFFNGIGRLLWASLSDKIGRIIAFRWLIALEVICFSLLIVTQNVVLFCILVCLVLLCYGGGFGILPSLIKDEFGAERMPKIYGIMLTGWGIGGVIGTLSTAFFKGYFCS